MSDQGSNRAGASALVHAIVGNGPPKTVHVAQVEEFASAELELRASTAREGLPVLVLLKPLRDAELFDVRWSAPDEEQGPCEHGVLAASHWLFATGRAPGDEVEFRSPVGKLWARREGEGVALCVAGPLSGGRADPIFIRGSARIVHEGPPRDERPNVPPSASLLATRMPEWCGDGVVLTEVLASSDLPARLPFFVGSFSVAPHCASDPHSHESAEVWYIASGSGRVLSGGREIQVRRGDFVYLTPQTTHQIENPGNEPLEATSVCWSC